MHTTEIMSTALVLQLPWLPTNHVTIAVSLFNTQICTTFTNTHRFCTNPSRVVRLNPENICVQSAVHPTAEFTVFTSLSLYLLGCNLQMRFILFTDLIEFPNKHWPVCEVTAKSPFSVPLKENRMLEPFQWNLRRIHIKQWNLEMRVRGRCSWWSLMISRYEIQWHSSALCIRVSNEIKQGQG